MKKGMAISNTAVVIVAVAVLAVMMVIVLYNYSLAEEKPDNIYGSGIIEVEKADFLNAEPPTCRLIGENYQLALAIDTVIKEPGGRSGDVVMMAESEFTQREIQRKAEALRMESGGLQGVFRVNLLAVRAPQNGDVIRAAFFFTEPCTYSEAGTLSGGDTDVEMRDLIEKCPLSFLGLKLLELPSMACT